MCKLPAARFPFITLGLLFLESREFELRIMLMFEWACDEAVMLFGDLIGAGF
jgi:hypothetical protein